MSFLPENVTSEQRKDSGLALVLICLITYQFTGAQILIPLALILLISAMTFPVIFHPFAKLWFGISHAVGTLASKIVLSILFFTVVTPVGLLRRLIGKDSMRIREWRKGPTSVFKTREHSYSGKDLENPY